LVPVPRRQASQQAVQLLGVEQRAIPWEQDDALGVILFGPCDPRQHGHHVALVGGIGKHLRAARRDDLLRPRVAADHDRALDRSSPGDRLERVLQHRCDQLLTPLVADARGKAPLRLREALHRQYRGCPHPSARVAA
jgi:hypothetical protein